MKIKIPIIFFLLLVGFTLPLAGDRSLSEIGHPAEGALTFVTVIKMLTILSAFTAIILIVYLQFFRKERVIDPGKKWLYFMALFILPIFTMFGGTYFALEEFKEIESCMGCHQMHSFGGDMIYNKESQTLAALHYRDKWINAHQCYTCHTGYGVAGTVQSKIDGLRHLYGKYTGFYERPVRLRGEFPNSNCLTCHIGQDKYESVQIHRALHERLFEDQISCMRCHGNVHPSIHERLYPTVTYRGEKYR